MNVPLLLSFEQLAGASPLVGSLNVHAVPEPPDANGSPVDAVMICGVPALVAPSASDDATNGIAMPAITASAPRGLRTRFLARNSITPASDVGAAPLREWFRRRSAPSRSTRAGASRFRSAGGRPTP